MEVKLKLANRIKQFVALVSYCVALGSLAAESILSIFKNSDSM